MVESLSKKHQLFLDSPNGEINVYLILANDAQRNNNNVNNSFASEGASSRLPTSNLNNITENVKTNVSEIKMEID